MNFLKVLNDTYRHLIGDKALIALANCLKEKVTRNTDLVARCGGDEFVVVLRIEKDFGKEKAAALKDIFEKIKEIVNNLSIDFIYENKPVNFKIRTAMGYVVLNRGDDHKTSEELLHIADSEMYNDKTRIKSEIK